jgi:hypothetical protein
MLRKFDIFWFVVGAGALALIVSIVGAAMI